MSIRGAETSQVNAYQFMGVIPLFPGLNGSVSVRNFHLNDYPVHRRSSLRTHDDAQEDYKQELNSDMMGAGAS